MAVQYICDVIGHVRCQLLTLSYRSVCCYLWILCRMVAVSFAMKNMRVSTSKGLYKYLLRECQKLPKDANEFYKHTIKQVRFL
jgi:hypothetical protein